MQTRGDAITDINAALSWIMVSFLCINRYHFLARWHKHNTIIPINIFFALCHRSEFCVWATSVRNQKLMYTETIQFLCSIDFLEGLFLSSFYVFISMITAVDAFGLGCAVKRSKYRQQQKMASYYSHFIHNDVTLGFRARVQFLPILHGL